MLGLGLRVWGFGVWSATCRVSEFEGCWVLGFRVRVDENIPEFTSNPQPEP